MTRIANIILLNNSLNALSNTEEIQYSEIYMTAIENQAKIAKIYELENWKRQEVYCDEKDIGQWCISVGWVLSHQIKNGGNVVKARLCARGFEEIKDFPINSPSCSQIGAINIYLNSFK